MSRNAKFDLRTRIFLAPNMETPSKALATLAHSGKSPMARPLTTSENLGVHTYSIIAYPDREIGLAKSNFGLYMAGLRMLVRVVDRFAYDAKNVVTNNGTQLSWPALHDHAVLRP
jgi:hypothetical protein